MKINITKKQYNAIIRSLELTGGMFGLMKDSFEDTDLDSRYQEMTETQQALLPYHKDFWFEYGEIDKESDKYYLNDTYTREVYDELEEFGMYEFHEKLTFYLARRDIEELRPELLHFDGPYNAKLAQAVADKQEEYNELIEKYGLDGLRYIWK